MSTLPSEPLEEIRSQTGQTLLEMSRGGPVLVVFVRHSGCTFCRQMLAELAGHRTEIDAAEIKIAVVHMMKDDAEAERLLSRYGLEDVARFSDPEQILYRGFELRRGSLMEIAGPRVWWKGFKSTVLSGFLPGIPSGDIYQLPGAFLIQAGEIVKAHRSDTSAEQPDWSTMIATD